MRDVTATNGLSPYLTKLIVSSYLALFANSKAVFFIAGNLFFFYISMIFPRNSCFLCAMCGNVTIFSFSDPKYTVQNPLWKRQLFPAFINVMIENNMSHKSGANSTFYKVVMKVFPLLLHICIRNDPFCFAVTWCPSGTSMYLSLSSNDPRMKYETYGVMWHVDPESKIQMVNCELSPYFSLLQSSSQDICLIDAYILWLSLSSPLLHEQLPFLLKLTCLRHLSLSFGGLGHFEIMWSLDPHLNNFGGGRSEFLLYETSTARVFSFSCLIF